MKLNMDTFSMRGKHLLSIFLVIGAHRDWEPVIVMPKTERRRAHTDKLVPAILIASQKIETSMSADEGTVKTAHVVC